MTTEQLPIARIERADDKIIVSFAVTVIDVPNLAIIADELDEIVRSRNPQSVVIDLTGVRRIDDLGLALLQSIKQSVKEVGGNVVFSGVSDQMKRSINETRIARVVHQALR